MTAPQNAPNPAVLKSVMDVLYQRRSVRNFTPQMIEQSCVRMLLDAAVQAPTAKHIEPWAFVVIQDKNLMNRISDSVKEMARLEVQGIDTPSAQRARDRANNPNYNSFHNAGTLILICSKTSDRFEAADCWLAAENLSLAAFANGLGTCVIGSAVAALNTPEWKAELKIPAKMTVIAPLTLGVPAGENPPVSRKPPEILAWL